MKPLNDSSTPDELHDAARAVIKFAESMSENPGIAATIITDAALIYAANQRDAEGALALQVDFLVSNLTKWLTADKERLQ